MHVHFFVSISSMFDSSFVGTNLGEPEQAPTTSAQDCIDRPLCKTDVAMINEQVCVRTCPHHPSNRQLEFQFKA